MPDCVVVAAQEKGMMRERAVISRYLGFKINPYRSASPALLGISHRSQFLRCVHSNWYMDNSSAHTRRTIGREEQRLFGLFDSSWWWS